MGEIIVIVVFIISSFIFLARAYLPIIKDMGNSHQEDAADMIAQELAVLKGRNDQIGSGSTEKAAAFIRLIDLSYVLVHILVNKGNNYDDEVQSKKFQNSLTSELISKLNTVEGRYE